MNRRTRIAALLLALLFAAAMMAGCGGRNQTNHTPDAATSGAADSNIEVSGTDIVIETAYGRLCYPVIWKDNFRYEISEEDPYTVRFLGEISEANTAELFSIVFGEKGDVLVGSIGGDKACNVYLSPVTELNKAWTADELATFQAMQEELNYTVEKLSELDSFTKA